MTHNWLVEFWKTETKHSGSHAQMSEQKKYIKPKQNDILRRYFSDYKSAKSFAKSIFDRGDFHVNLTQG